MAIQLEYDLFESIADLTEERFAICLRLPFELCNLFSFHDMIESPTPEDTKLESCIDL